MKKKTTINTINLLVNLIKVFIKNFIWYFRVIENTNNLKINPSIKINLEYQFNRILHFSILFKYKEIHYSNVKYANNKTITGKLLSTLDTIAKTNLNNFQFISVSSNEEKYNKTIEGNFGLGYPDTNMVKHIQFL